ncbi:MAG: hypothetical protein DBX46_01330 [Clostridiales bacterium]|nr:MAG: hypothetical protein DBX46_01330 [Clostridiales bacterium]
MKERGNLRDELLIAYETDDPVENVLFQKERLVRVNAAKTAFRGVVFESCTFEDCDFSGCDMRKAIFRKCLLVGCDFSGGYWNGCTLDSCNASGCDMGDSRIVDTNIQGSQFQYAVCWRTRWEDCRISDTAFTEACLNEMILKRTEFYNVDMTKAELMGTMLKGIDLSGCTIDGIVISDSKKELAGAQVNVGQAIALARLLGVKVV